MQRTRSLTIVCSFLLVCAASADAQITKIRTQLPSPKTLAKLDLERAWWNQATMDYHRDRVRFMVADEESVYIQSTGGAITAFDSETGKRRWSLQLGIRDQPSYAVTTNDEYALVTVGTTLYAVTKLKGEVAWQLRLPGVPSTSPTADPERIYIGMQDGSVYAFSLKIIRENYEAGRLPQWSYETIVWRYKTGKQILTPPIAGQRALQVSGDDTITDPTPARTVTFASQDKSLYSLIGADRKVNWQFETDSVVSAPIAFANGTVYFASEDFTCYALDAETGQVFWPFNAGQPIRKAPKIVANRLFLCPRGGGMFVLNAKTGQELGRNPEATEFLAATENYYFVSDALGNVLVLSNKGDEGFHAKRPVLQLRHFNIRISNDRTDRLFLATDTGMVTCIKEKGSEFPTYHMFPDRRPILPVMAADAGYENDDAGN